MNGVDGKRGKRGKDGPPGSGQKGEAGDRGAKGEPGLNGLKVSLMFSYSMPTSEKTVLDFSTSDLDKSSSQDRPFVLDR